MEKRVSLEEACRGERDRSVDKGGAHINHRSVLSITQDSALGRLSRIRKKSCDPPLHRLKKFLKRGGPGNAACLWRASGLYGLTSKIERLGLDLTQIGTGEKFFTRRSLRHFHTATTITGIGPSCFYKWLFINHLLLYSCRHTNSDCGVLALDDGLQG